MVVIPYALLDEGVYTATDIDIDIDPYLWRQGKDSQLERSIAEINKMLANYRSDPHARPAYPDRTKVDARY